MVGNNFAGRAGTLLLDGTQQSVVHVNAVEVVIFLE